MIQAQAARPQVPDIQTLMRRRAASLVGPLGGSVAASRGPSQAPSKFALWLEATW